MRDQLPEQATSSKTILHFIILLAAIVIPVGGLGFWYAQWRLNPLQIRIDEVQKKLPGSSTPTTNPTLVQQSKLEEQLFNFQKERTDLEQKIMIGFIQLMGGLFVAATVYISWQNFKQTQKNVAIAAENLRKTQKSIEVAEDKQLTERFTQAINQLGTETKEGEGDKIAIRLGGIYALERIAKDSEKDHWTIMEVLTAFIRVKSPSSETEKSSDSDLQQSQKELFPGITPDVQAALTVIGRRKKREEPEKLDLSGVNLREANLIGARLSGANFSSSKLSRAKLNGADLTGANLRGADLRGAKRDGCTKFDPKWELVYQLVNVTVDRIVAGRWEEKIREDVKNKDLSEANLSGVYFHENDLSEANFSGVNFSGAILEYVDISETNFSGANFSHATLQVIFPRKENCSGPNFSEANFAGAVLRSVDFSGADLTNARFFQATIEDGDFSKAYLQETDFRGADLRKANLCGFDFRRVIIDEETMLDDKWRLVARLQKIDRKVDQDKVEDFKRVNLSRANLKSVNLRKANLREANLREADLYKADLSGADLSGADLSGADLSRASLGRVNFRGTIISEETKLDDKYRLIHRLVNEGGANADLRNTYLTDADLRGVDFSNANLNGVSLRGAIINEDTKLDGKWRLVHRLVNEDGVNTEDLSGVDLSGAKLWFVDFSDANLKGVNLKDADLEGVNLKGANLKDADLEGANLKDANLEGTNLWRANLTETNFWASDLKDDKLARAKEKSKQMIQAGENWKDAKYSPDIRTWLGLPPES
jgi:uncharacterized protein YjbI with pentapeptide repeats